MKSESGMRGYSGSSQTEIVALRSSSKAAFGTGPEITPETKGES